MLQPPIDDYLINVLAVTVLSILCLLKQCPRIVAWKFVRNSCSSRFDFGQLILSLCVFLSFL